jgi:hypothetical protein
VLVGTAGGRNGGHPVTGGFGSARPAARRVPKAQRRACRAVGTRLRTSAERRPPASAQAVHARPAIHPRTRMRRARRALEEVEKGLTTADDADVLPLVMRYSRPRLRVRDLRERTIR